MKLSKQERIGVLVIAVILILGLGIWLFIVPKVNAINASNAQLDAKKAELVAAEEKRALKDDLKTQVMDAYKSGENLANMFFEEMTPYEVDAEFRAFLDQLDVNVFVESVTVSNATTYTLAPTYFAEQEVTYPLKEYVTSGLQPTEEELAAASRQTILRDTLGTSQTVGSIAVDFDVKALSMEDLIKFCDEVNAYFKEENGTSTRKAIMMDAASFEYPEVEEAYTEIIDAIELEAEDTALNELYANHGLKRPADAGTTQNPDNNNEEGEETLALVDYIYTMPVHLTFYSVERMQDPTEQLEAQEQ